MNLEKLQCFVDIVKYDSFTKAAQKNHITQAGISQQIASMEAELGLLLFERSKRGFTLTAPGESFYANSLHLLAQYSRSLSQARCVANNLSGYVSMGVWPGLDMTHIYAVIDRLLDRYPSMQIVFRADNPVELRHKYALGKVAMTVAMPFDLRDGAVSDAVVEPLFTCGYHLYVSPKHPLAQSESLSISDIQEEKFAVLNEECIGLQAYSHIVIEQMRHRNDLVPAFEVPNFETQQMLVATGQAVMLLPELCRPTAAFPFCRVRLRDYSERCTFSAIWRSNQASPVLLSLAELLKAHFQELGVGR